MIEVGVPTLAQCAVPECSPAPRSGTCGVRVTSAQVRQDRRVPDQPAQTPGSERLLFQADPHSCGVDVLHGTTHLSLSGQRESAEPVQLTHVVRNVGQGFLHLLGELDRRRVSIVEPLKNRRPQRMREGLGCVGWGELGHQLFIMNHARINYLLRVPGLAADSFT